MFRELWTFLIGHLVEEVPDEMAACLDCGTVDCRASRYNTCPNRLSRAAALRAARSARSVHVAGEGEG